MNLKRLMASLLAIAATTSMLTACGSKTEEPAPTEEPTAETTETADAADLVLTNGIVTTMVAEGDTAEAVAVKDGEIIYVGDAAGAEALTGEDTEVLDLQGKMVTPGFIDGHTHTIANIIKEQSIIYLNETEPTLEAYIEVAKAFNEAHPDDEVVYGSGLDLNAFENSVPTKEWLDEIFPDKPVIIHDMSIHGTLLNSKAIEMCGITNETEPPMNGIIYKDDDGNLTGYFSDASSLFTAIPAQEFTDEQYEDAFKVYQTECSSYGITGIDTGGGQFEPNRERAILSGMEQDGELNLRVNLAHFADMPFDLAEAEKQIAVMDEGQQYNSDFLNSSQIKATFDGVPEAMTVALLEPYAETAGVDADYTGPELTPQEDFEQYVSAINAAGYQVNIHAMGDASVRLALDGIEYSIEQNGEDTPDNIITHFNLVKPEDIARTAEMNVFAAMQPIWWYYDPIFSPLEVQSLGEDRFSTEYHIKDLVDAGIRITGSVDYPVTLDYRPLAGIQVGATQCSPYDDQENDDQYLRNADQAVSVYEMLKMYTINGAQQMQMDDKIGTIEVGKKADLTVLSADITAIDPKEIANTEVVYTISDGRFVYGK